MNWSQFWWNLAFLTVGSIVSGLVTWGLSRYYYRRAANDLRREADELRGETSKVRTHTRMLIIALEQLGWIKNVRRDSDGNPAGWEYTYLGSGGIRFGGSAQTEFQSGKKDKEK